MDSTHETDEGVFDSVVNSNLKSAFCMTVAAAQQLEKSRGKW